MNILIICFLFLENIFHSFTNFFFHHILFSDHRLTHFGRRRFHREQHTESSVGGFFLYCSSRDTNKFLIFFFFFRKSLLFNFIRFSFHQNIVINIKLKIHFFLLLPILFFSARSFLFCLQCCSVSNARTRGIPQQLERRQQILQLSRTHAAAADQLNVRLSGVNIAWAGKEVQCVGLSALQHTPEQKINFFSSKIFPEIFHSPLWSFFQFSLQFHRNEEFYAFSTLYMSTQKIK